MNGNRYVLLKTKIMRETYLIDIEDIKNNSVVPSNTDEKILLIALAEVTDLELEQLIGAEYLTKLEHSILNDTLSNKDADVIEKVIQPFLLYGTLAYAIPYLHTKVNNKGVNVSTDATLSASPAKQVDSFQTLVKIKWDAYKRRLIEYFKNDSDEETVTNRLADTTSASLGFYIPDKTDNFASAYKARAHKTNNWRN